jgi:DNA-binding CsgD family transcriptional regulator
VTSQVRPWRPARPFVGRARELQLAADALTQALAGRGGAILLAGEPGIGKTGLAGQIAAQAADLGIPVGWGRCVEDEGAPPLWPWRQILSACRRQLTAGGRGADLPGLGFLPSTAAGRRERDTAAAPADGSGRFRLLEAATQTVVAAAGRAGLVVVLDDLHWADPLSALLLAHLGRDLAASRVLVIAAYRDQGMSSNAVGGAIAALAGEPGTVHLRLGGLAEAEVADQLEATFGHRLDTEVIAGVARRTGGNPFFVAELGRLLEDATQAGHASAGVWETGLPLAVRAVIGQRLGRLPASCRDVLRTGAVIGTAVDVGTLAAGTGLTTGAVLAELDTAAGAGLVQATPGQPAVEFSHALVRDTLHAEVPLSRRLDIHRRVAEHIEATHRGDLDRHAAELAHHWLAALPAADACRAVDWAERAAAAAMTGLGYEEAARLYQRALHATGSGRFTGTDRRRLLLGQAQALFKSGDIGAAIAAASQAADEAGRCGDPVAMAHAALALEGVADDAWGRRVIQVSEAALRQLGDDRTELRARLLAALAVAHSSSLATDGSADRAEPLSRQALALAEAAGTPAALVSALRARQMACAGPDGVDDRLDTAERMLALSAANSDPWAGLWGRLWRIEARCQLGATDAAELDVDGLAHLTELLRQPVADWHLARTRCSLAIGRGHFTEAAHYLDEAVRLAGRGLDARARQIQALMGAKLASLTGDPHHQHWLATLDTDAKQAGQAGRRLTLIVYLASRGERDQAIAHYQRLPPWRGWQVPRFLAHAALDQRARAAALLGDVDGAAVAYQRLRPWARYFVVGGSGLAAMHGSAEFTLGCLAACLGKPEAAIGHLRSALAANRRAGLPPFEAESQYELAKILARPRREDRAEALLLAGDAARAAARLGMSPLRADAERLTQTLHSAAQGTGPAGLTRREQEIAALVARGLTNRQIADVLQIAERTAENHVQHILTKLGFRNRAQIAAWAATPHHGHPTPT